VNLELARLEAARGDANAALRYYHNALYAPWTAEQTDTRRAVRLELIRFLLTTHQSGRAESELVALSTDLPNTPALRLQVGNLFLSVGDNQRALDQFEQALGLAPQDAAVPAGPPLPSATMRRPNVTCAICPILPPISGTCVQSRTWWSLAIRLRRASAQQPAAIG
jgi:tetratricopeptide (TPR) repeat protein